MTVSAGNLSQSASRPQSAPQTRTPLWWARMTCIGIWFAVVSLVMLPVGLVLFRNPLSNALFVRLLAPVARRILGVKVVCRKPAGDLFREPSVLIMNHQAAFDILLNSDFLPGNCVVIAKRSILLIPVFGWFFYLAGNLLINRKDRRQSLSQLAVAEEAMMKQRYCVWIFPEGTRTHGREMGRFKKGAFHLAVKTQAPLVPIVSSSYYGRLNFNRWNAGTVIVEVLPPIPTRGNAEVSGLLEQTEQRMRAAAAALDAELDSSMPPDSELLRH